MDYEEALKLVKELPGYYHSHKPYIDFDGTQIPHVSGLPDDVTTYSGVHVTLVAEDGKSPNVYYVLGVSKPEGWEETIPPAEHHEALKASVNVIVDAIRAVGVKIETVTDQSPALIVPTIWSDWHDNPFNAIKQAIDTNKTPEDWEKVKATVLKMTEWPSIAPENFLDDLLQEIAGDTNIVAQYSSERSERQYRAAYDVG